MKEHWSSILRIGISIVAINSCGIELQKSSVNIVGGRLATLNDRESLSTVALTRNGSSFCTGTLIDSTHVITAAHCLGGEFKISFGLMRPFSATVDVADILPHPNGFDIAVVKLAVPAPDWTKPVRILSSTIKLQSGQRVILAGYGQTSGLGGEGGKLKVVDTRIDREASETSEIWFGPTPGFSACRGDSGGPMYFVDDKNEYFLVGSTIGGFGPPACSGSGHYSDVRAHSAWIGTVIQ